jgi:hypothetical protein
MLLENHNTNALDPCLIIPTAARSIEAIEQYVGNIQVLPSNRKWCYVSFTLLEAPNDKEVWKHPRAHFIQQPLQCWVHVDYTGYRMRYRCCFPEIDTRGMVIDHILNRRFARVLGYNYIRLIHVGRGINSSSGRGMEYDVINYNNPDGLDKFTEHEDLICYADPSDLMKILNLKVGAFPLNNVRDSLHLFYG